MAEDIFTDEELKALETAETEAQEQTETKVETTEEATDDRPRDEQGRFVSKEATEEDDPKPKGDTVPQGALHAERERRKTAESELKKANEQLQALAALREQVKSRTPATVEKPEGDDTGIEHLNRRLAEVETRTTDVSKTLDLQRIEQAEHEHLAAVAAQSDAAYRAIKPDYDDAIRYLVEARAKELTLYGYDPVQARNVLGNETVEIVRSAVALGKDPAEMAYTIAQSRGYRPAEGSGEGKRTVEAVANAREQGRSLGQAAGSTPKQLTAEAIINMSPEEFEALYMTPDGRKLIDGIAAGNA
jgi:hypothetical protein